MSGKVIWIINRPIYNIVSDFNKLELAELCYTAYRDYLIDEGEDDDGPWSDIGDYQQQSNISRIEYFLENINLSVEEIHAKWKAEKELNGWVYGTSLDVKNKIHPFLVDFASLPETKKQMDIIFKDIVDNNVTVQTI